jgi:parvulin-like peptidyl-prolyl isomerase
MNELNPIESKKNKNMKTKTKMIFSAALAVALIALPRAQAATGGNTAPATATNVPPADAMAALFGDPVIVKGQGFEIKQSQLDDVVNPIKSKAAAAGQMISSDQLAKITQATLNSLIGTQILLQKATDADKAEGKKDADQIIAQKIKQFGSQELVEQQLKAIGKTLDEWRADMTQQATATAVMIRELNAAPTDADVKKYYNDNPTNTVVPEQVHVRHILLLTLDSTTGAPLPDDQVKAKKKQIDDILKQARAGADFAKLAKDNSEDPTTKDNGGELPPFAHGQMVPSFDAAAFSLTNNQISDVVTTQYGYHIIQLLGRTSARKLVLTDKVPQGDATLAEEIKNFLTGQKLREVAPAYIEKLNASPGVEILDPALKALMASARTNSPVASKP